MIEKILTAYSGRKAADYGAVLKTEGSAQTDKIDEMIHIHTI